jgi:ABC-type dipeptide/oligopeptide/nickel transport system permease component
MSPRVMEFVRALLPALRRLLWIVVTMWVVYTLTWFLMRIVPGGPFSSERQLSEAARRNFEQRYRLDLPLVQQYAFDIGHALRGDLGLSYRMQDFTVNDVIYQGFPVSASLGILAVTFALFFGIIAGSVSAARRNSPIDAGMMSMAALGIAVPNFVLASLAIVPFVFWLRLVPAGGWGTFQQLLLPAVCLAAPLAAYIARLTRAGMLEVLNLDYIRTAYSKGLSEQRVVIHHALRGSLLPVISFLGPATAAVLTGSLVIERIFNIPGMGSHFVEAALQRDYTLALGLVMAYTALLLFMNTLVDLSYALIDPRVKVE